MIYMKSSAIFDTYFPGYVVTTPYTGIYPSGQVPSGYYPRQQELPSETQHVNPPAYQQHSKYSRFYE